MRRPRLAAQLGEHNVYTSWGPEPRRVDDEEANFARIWANKAQRVIVLDVPDAVRQDLMRFMPSNGMPARLRESEKKPRKPSPENPKLEAKEARKAAAASAQRVEKPRLVFHSTCPLIATRG